MLFCLGMVFTFGVGGLTGLYLADVVADMYLHDTYFVVGHFHLIMAAALLLSLFAAVYFWYPKMFGRMLSERLGKLHFWLTFLPLNVVFIGQLILGVKGMQRRLYDPSVYEAWRPLAGLNRGISHAAYLLGAAQLLFVWNFFMSLWRRADGARQPMGGRDAGVVGPLPAPAPQLRHDPGGRARAARAGQPRRPPAGARLAEPDRAGRRDGRADAAGRDAGGRPPA